jgi:hypothetical protein
MPKDSNSRPRRMSDSESAGEDLRRRRGRSSTLSGMVDDFKERQREHQEKKKKRERDREIDEQRRKNARALEERGGIFRVDQAAVQTTSTGFFGAVVESKDTVTPARPGKDGTYRFEADNPVGRRPIVIYGTRDQIKERLQRDPNTKVENNIGDQPKLYMSVRRDRLGAYDATQAKRALFPAQQAVLLLRDSGMIPFADNAIDQLKWAATLPRGTGKIREYGTIITAFAKDVPQATGHRDALTYIKDKLRQEDTSEPRYAVTISPNPEKGSVEIGKSGQATFGDFSRSLAHQDGWADAGGPSNAQRASQPFEPDVDAPFIDDDVEDP